MPNDEIEVIKDEPQKRKPGRPRKNPDPETVSEKKADAPVLKVTPRPITEAKSGSPRRDYFLALRGDIPKEYVNIRGRTFARHTEIVVQDKHDPTRGVQQYHRAGQVVPLTEKEVDELLDAISYRYLHRIGKSRARLTDSPVQGDTPLGDFLVLRPWEGIPARS